MRSLMVRNHFVWAFLLAYLLIASGAGSALLWCREPGSLTHLEYNLFGSCQDDPASEKHCATRGPLPQAAFQNAADGSDCFDFAAPVAHAPKQPYQKFFSAPVAIFPREVFAFTRDLPSLLRLYSLSLPDIPPPYPALLFLRTVVLLH